MCKSFIFLPIKESQVWKFMPVDFIEDVEENVNVWRMCVAAALLLYYSLHGQLDTGRDV